MGGHLCRAGRCPISAAIPEGGIDARTPPARPYDLLFGDRFSSRSSSAGITGKLKGGYTTTR